MPAQVVPAVVGTAVAEVVDVVLVAVTAVMAVEVGHITMALAGRWVDPFSAYSFFYLSLS